jgi:endoglucanase
MKKRLLLMLALAFACWQMVSAQGPVSCYGQLKVSGNNIVGSKTGSTPVQVKGVSLGWSNTGWHSAAYFNQNSVNQFVDRWKAEVIRVPLGVGRPNHSERQGDYTNDPNGNKTRVKTAVSAAIAKGVYVIIDWHDHVAHTRTSEAKAFFKEMAQEYGHHDNVIFEIYNEPLETDWNTIRTYANEIISEIRKHSDNLILVGTRNFSQCLADISTSNKISDTNTAYVLHFYAANQSLDTWTPAAGKFRAEIETARSRGLAVFVSEWGACNSDGAGGVNASNANAWHQFLDQNKISSCAWQAGHASEASAFFKNDVSNNTDANSWTTNLKENGSYVYNLLATHYQTATWKNCSGCDVKYSVTFNSDGAGTITPQEICAGSYALEPTAPRKSGYRFDGWYNGATKYVFTNPVNANLSLVAKWIEGAEPTLIADAEDNNRTRLNTYWFAYNDADNGGSSDAKMTSDGVQYSLLDTFIMASGGADGTEHAVYVDYKLVKGTNTNNPFFGIGFNLNEESNESTTPVAYDLTGATGVSFWYKGPAIKFKMQMTPDIAVGWDDYAASIEAATDWTKVIIEISDLAQAGWGTKADLLLNKIAAFQWQVEGANGSTGKFWIDEVTIEGKTLSLPGDDPDPDPCPITYTVTFNSNGGTSVLPQEVCEGKTAKNATTTKTGYTFDGWYNGNYPFVFSTVITSNITLTARWTEAPIIEPTSTVIADCEKQNATNFGTYWYSYKTGESLITPDTEVEDAFEMTAPGYDGTGYAAVATGFLARPQANFYESCGIGFAFSDPEENYDLTGATGISFYHKGAAINFSVMLSTVTPDAGYDYSCTVAAHANWTLVTIAFPNSSITSNGTLAQASWVPTAEQKTWDPSKVTKLQWQIKDGVARDYEFGIDEVTVLDKVLNLPVDPVNVDTNESITFSIYPNPAQNGNFNIILEGTASVSVVSLQGQTVYSTVVDGSSAINANLEAGVYMVLVQSENGVKAQKLIVK